MKHNQVPTLDSVHMITVQNAVAPPAPPPGSIPPLSSASVPGNRLTIRIEKYGTNDIVNYPSMEDYVRQAFYHPVIKAEGRYDIFLNRAANLIAQRSRRGAGNIVFTSPNTKMPPTTGKTYGYSMTHKVLNWLGDKEALVVYSGNLIDNGFVWKPKDDGTIDVVAIPAGTGAINEVAGYGQFVSLI